MSPNRVQQIILLMILWAAILRGYDLFANHAPPSIPPTQLTGKPLVVTTFTHFCCTGCYDKMFSAAKYLSWIVTASVDRDTLKSQDERQKEDVRNTADVSLDYNRDATLYLDEKELSFVDLVKADRTFRDAGLVPKRMLVRNIAHFNLVAVDVHLCCGLCQSAAMTSLGEERNRQKAEAIKQHIAPNQIKDSELNLNAFVVDKSAQTVKAEFYSQADVTAFVSALQRAGFSPRELKIEILK